MAKHRGSILLDTNAILESYRVGGWPALAGGYCLETVQDCVAETQTGSQRHRAEQQIDPFQLRDSFATIHTVSGLQRVELALRVPGITLDLGETGLWAHVLGRSDCWILCGPDKASLHMGVRLGFGDRLVALERLFKDVGYRPKVSLRQHYGISWLAKTRTELILVEASQKA